MRFALLLVLLGRSLNAQGDAWKKLDFLVGDWTGVADAKDGQLGPGQGDFSFQPELKQHTHSNENASTGLMDLALVVRRQPRRRAENQFRRVRPDSLVVDDRLEG